MKKALPTLLSIFMSIGLLQAQITVTLSDFGSAGATVVQGNDTTLPAGISIGTTGNTTWDFSNLQADELDTLEFIDPATTASAGLFPNATVAIEDASGLAYLKTSSTGIELDGIDGDYFNLGAVVALNINPNITLFPLPATNNTTYSDFADIDSTLDDTYTGVFDSLRVRRVTNVDGKVDAFGTITLPGNNTYNVLRHERREINADTVWGKVAILGWQQVTTNFDTVYTYSWIANGEDYPVLEMIGASPNGPFTSAVFTIGPDVQATISGQTPTSCNGDCDGTATVTGISGTGNYTYLWDAAAANQTTATATGLCAGNYSVTVSDGLGSTVASASVSEPGVLSAGASSTVDETFNGNDGEISLNVSGGTSPYTIAWTGPNGYTGNGSNISGLVGGAYVATVTDDNGCTTTANISIGSAVGLNEYAINRSLNVFPNPATDLLILEVEGNAAKEIRIMNLLGEVLEVQRATADRTELDISNLPPGHYLVQVDTEAGWATRKFVVLR
ncbi:MAG: T9SS type A sorting domain-containing protein [Salibacteraceae bacterium]